jgi:type II secretory pathway pseudopilin PulG
VKTRAFSIAEVMVVVAIVTLLATILSPVLWRIKHSANVLGSTARLHQLGVSVRLYQTDYELQGADVFALPPFQFVYTDFFGLGREFFVSPCGYKDGIEDNQMRLSYQYWGGFETNQPLFEKYGERSVLFSDPHCNESADQWKSRYQSKRGLAVLYSGAVVNKFKTGDPSQMGWWSE